MRRMATLCLLAALLTGSLAGAASAADASPLLAPLAGGQTLPLPAVDPALPSPAAFLGYPLGERFTRYADVLAYLGALDAASPRVAMWKYGETYEHRPLVLVAVSSAANIAALDSLRDERLKLDHPERLAEDGRAQLLRDQPAVVWLAYGVHGNESSSTEAAMAAAYLLAGGQGDGAIDLDRTLVLIDPLVNPDGRERYVAAHQQRRGGAANPDPFSREHEEPWPGGRGNHYYIDLNRDWAWATQQETRARVAAVGTWEPQVYVDFHEMGAESTYFFPPTAEPVHPVFGAATRRWLDAFGHANAAAFDRLGWTYYVGEEYDFFYPAYGDTYPTLRGGIGMTYEVAGGGAAGSVVERSAAGTWGLADRIARHLTTSLSTVATSAAQSRQLLADFVDARVSQARNGKTIFLWRDGQEAAALARLLALHGLAVARLGRDEEIEATPLAGGEPRKLKLPAGTWGVSTAQPLGALAQALLEREAALPAGYVERQRERVTAHLEPEFYDVTAWSLPLAYNLDAWTTTDGVPASLGEAAQLPPGGLAGSGRVGYLLPPSGLAGYRFAAALLRQGVPFRLALEPLTLGGRELPAGTLFVPREGRSDLDARLAPLAVDAGVQLVGAESSLSTRGIPLGSERMVGIKKPRIGLLAGRGVASTSFGALWHLLDEEVGAAHSVLDLERFEDVELSRFDVLVLPEGGGYGRALGDDGVTRLKAWVDAGGVLVGEGSAVDWLHDKQLTVVARHKESDQQQSDGEGSAPAAADAEKVWDTELMVPGAIVATELRHHLLTVGAAEPPPALFWGSSFYDATGDPQQDLLRVRAHDPVLAGVAWPEAKQLLPGTLLMGAETRGRGRVVVFTQDPAFRLFWRGTMPLLLDAVLYGPSL
ncbi:MAG TPA: M14 family zinc carboxypeptidase [Thermoanaerobaculia bacterium]|nr:M14 family zinc carboxypeptidase [Thermoanaerobaculia bacterium]